MQRLFVVSHTHWDREWYEPFQVFRLRLVQCIDKLLVLFENDPEYEYFLLDGQTIVLEDYGEVRPDREQALRVLVGAGKVQIGPWYVLPDEFLVSGESLIRNLMRGLRVAGDFGGGMHIGYIPDPFGHVSQMP
ncbi:MAG TPA: glycoside hydrolase, partial [Anaerolineae bacterium]